MHQGKRYISLLTILALLVALLAALVMPQTAVLAKDKPPHWSDNRMVGAGPGFLCPGGIGIDNPIINIDYFGERQSGYDVVFDTG